MIQDLEETTERFEKTYLKPCPFCGESRLSVSQDWDDIGGEWAFVRCRSCGCRTRGQWAKSENICPQFYQSARDEWNRRSLSVDESTYGR